MGNLMVRVLTSGFHRNDASVKAMAAIFLWGSSTAGPTWPWGWFPHILSTQAIIQSFNEIYLTSATERAARIGGDFRGWWGSDATAVALASAFTITRLACSDQGSGTDLPGLPIPDLQQRPGGRVCLPVRSAGLITAPIRPAASLHRPDLEGPHPAGSPG